MARTYTPANAVNHGALFFGAIPVLSGLTWDGQQLVILDRGREILRALSRNANGTYTPANQMEQGAYRSNINDPNGIAWDGQQLCIVHRAGTTTAYRVSLLNRNINGTYSPDINGNYNTPTVIGVANPVGITWDGQQLVILEGQGPDRNLYTLPRNNDGSYTGSNLVDHGVLPATMINPQGLAWDGLGLVFSEVTNDEIWTLERNANGTYTPANASNEGTLPSGLGAGLGVTWDGLQLALVNTSAQDLWTLFADNRPPEISAVTATPSTINHNGTTSLSVTATDPENDTLSYAWSSDIGGTFSDQDAATTNWAAPDTITDAATATLTVTVSDPGGLSVTGTAQVIIREEMAVPLALGTLTNLTGATGDIVNTSIEAASGGRSPYVYMISDLPFELGALGRNIRGRLIDPGVSTVTVSVTDANNDTVSGTFTWTVTGTAIPVPTGLNVRIDFGDVFFSNPNADVTARMRSGVDCVRGKNTNSSILGRTVAGTMTFQLDNHDGLYDDENMASPLHGLIRPGLITQFRNGRDVLWTGILDSIPTRYDKSPAAQHRAQVTGWGIFSTLKEIPVLEGSLEPELTVHAFCALLENINEVGIPQTGTYRTMQRWWELGSMEAALRHIEDTEGGFIYEARQPDLGFQTEGHRAALSVSKTFSGVSPLLSDEIPIVGIPSRKIAVKDVINTVSGFVRDFERKTDQIIFTLGTAFGVNRGSTVTLFFDYEENQGALESVEDPVATTDYMVNAAIDGSGSDRTSVLDVTAEINQFNELKITVSYPAAGSTEATLYVTSLQVKGAVLTATSSTKVTRTDEQSRARYRPKSLALRNTWISSRDIMQQRADALLAALATPETRYEFPWYVKDWADFTGLELSDKVKLKMPGYEVDCFIESIRLQVPLDQVLPKCTIRATLAT